MSDAVYVVLGFKGANGNLRFGLSEDPLGYVQNVRNGEYDGYRNLGASAEWCWACRVVSQDEGILLRNRLNG
jgi:hypothetical protein